MEGLSNGRQAKGDDARCPRVHPPFPASHGSGQLSPHSSLRPACQRPSATEAGPVPKPARHPAAGADGRRTGRKATTFGAALLLLRRNHDDHRRVDPAPARTSASMERQFMIISCAASLQRSASACRGAAGRMLCPIVPERRKAQHHQGFGRCKPADRGVKDTANTGKTLLPNLSTCSSKARPCQTPSTASAKSP